MADMLVLGNLSLFWFFILYRVSEPGWPSKMGHSREKPLTFGGRHWNSRKNWYWKSSELFEIDFLSLQSMVIQDFMQFFPNNVGKSIFWTKFQVCFGNPWLFINSFAKENPCRPLRVNGFFSGMAQYDPQSKHWFQLMAKFSLNHS